jgi:beta-glucosidase
MSRTPQPMLAVLLGLLFAANLWSQTASQPAYLNPALPLEQRVHDLVGRLTLEEKASQLVNQSRAIPRLHVPAYDWWSEALHGVASGTATVFPEPIGLAASFDPPLIHTMAIVIGTEGRAKYNMAVRAGRRRIFEGLTFWSPNINIFRDPRWGRGQETYGEDPFLTGRMAVAFVTGMQGDDPRYLRVVSTPKHFAVHSGPEPSRHTIDVLVSKHDEEDTYLPAFRDAVVEGKARSVMCVYNSVNGQPGCANDFLLKHTLRDQWGFNGYVVSDCDAVADIERGHHYVGTLAAAAAVSLKAGTDNDCADFFTPANGNSDYVRYLDAVKQGLLTEGDIDVTLKRLFRARIELGMFDPPEMVKYAETPDAENDSEAHRQLALEVARKTMVLLKNDGTLPLARSLKNIAVVGPLADEIRVLEGNYNATPSRATTALDGMRKQFPNTQIRFEPGTNFLRQATPVPASALTHADGQAGLQAEFFASAEFTGAPLATRIDREVNYDFSSAVAPPGITNLFVRWTGWLTPPESGTYRLGVHGIMNRLYLDDKLLVEDLKLHGPSPKTVDVQLEQGHPYAVRLESLGGRGLATKLIWMREIPDPLERAMTAASRADVVVAVVGITSDLEGEEMDVEVPGFQGGDRTSLDLPAEEEKLLQALKTAGKPLVVVLMNGSALAVNWAEQNANAILDAWYSGEEGGAAIAETLAGANNPAGRLPVTFYKGVDQLPEFTNYAMTERTYRYFHGSPLYPFGYGLSYSKFRYSNLQLSSQRLQAGDPLTAQVEVKNESGPDGDEVVEVYLTPPQIPGAPIRALRGLERIHLRAGETAHVKITLNPRDLSLVNLSGDRLVTPGEYQLSLGGGQPTATSAVVSGKFTIEGEQKLPE